LQVYETKDRVKRVGSEYFMNEGEIL